MGKIIPLNPQNLIYPVVVIDHLDIDVIELRAIEKALIDETCGGIILRKTLSLETCLAASQELWSLLKNSPLMFGFNELAAVCQRTDLGPNLDIILSIANDYTRRHLSNEGKILFQPPPKKTEKWRRLDNGGLICLLNGNMDIFNAKSSLEEINMNNQKNPKISIGSGDICLLKRTGVFRRVESPTEDQGRRAFGFVIIPAPQP